MDPLIHIPARIETYNDVSYAVFRLTQTLSAISVEAILFYSFEILRASHHGKLFYCIINTQFPLKVLLDFRLIHLTIYKSRILFAHVRQINIRGLILLSNIYLIGSKYSINLENRVFSYNG
jgi:hypothetical protein